MTNPPTSLQQPTPTAPQTTTSSMAQTAGKRRAGDVGDEMSIDGEAMARAKTAPSPPSSIDFAIDLLKRAALHHRHRRHPDPSKADQPSSYPAVEGEIVTPVDGRESFNVEYIYDSIPEWKHEGITVDALLSNVDPLSLQEWRASPGFTLLAWTLNAGYDQTKIPDQRSKIRTMLRRALPHSPDLDVLAPSPHVPIADSNQGAYLTPWPFAVVDVDPQDHLTAITKGVLISREIGVLVTDIAFEASELVGIAQNFSANADDAQSVVRGLREAIADPNKTIHQFLVQEFGVAVPISRFQDSVRVRPVEVKLKGGKDEEDRTKWWFALYIRPPFPYDSSKHANWLLAVRQVTFKARGCGASPISVSGQLHCVTCKRLDHFSGQCPLRSLACYQHLAASATPASVAGAVESVAEYEAIRARAAARDRTAPSRSNPQYNQPTGGSSQNGRGWRGARGRGRGSMRGY